MDNKILYTILNNDPNVKNLNFLGVFPINLVPIAAIRSQPCCLIVNTKPHTHQGEHWVAVVKTDDRNGLYFDSYGNPPFNLEEIGLVLDSCVEWTFNKIRLQSTYSAVCGQYCVFFLTHLAKGYSLKHITYLLNEGDSCSNDAFVFNYIKELYPYDELKDLSVVDFPFMFSQVSTANNI